MKTVQRSEMERGELAPGRGKTPALVILTEVGDERKLPV